MSSKKKWHKKKLVIEKFWLPGDRNFYQNFLSLSEVYRKYTKWSKKSDRKLKSYKKKSYKIFIFARPSNTKSKKWQKMLDFFLDDMVKKFL